MTSLVGFPPVCLECGRAMNGYSDAFCARCLERDEREDQRQWINDNG